MAPSPSTRPVKASQLQTAPHRQEQQPVEGAAVVGRLSRKSKSLAKEKYQDLLPKRKRANSADDPPPSKKKKEGGQCATILKSNNMPSGGAKHSARKVVPVNRYDEDDEDDTGAADDVAFAKTQRALDAERKRTAILKTKVAKISKPSTRSSRQDDTDVDGNDPVGTQDPGQDIGSDLESEDPQDAAFAGDEDGSASEAGDPLVADSGGEIESGEESEGLNAVTAEQTLRKEVPAWADSLDDDNDDDLPESFTASKSSRPKVVKTYGRASNNQQRDESDDAVSNSKNSLPAVRTSAKRTADAESLFDINEQSRRSATPATKKTAVAKKTKVVSTRRQEKARLEQPSFASDGEDGDAATSSDENNDRTSRRNNNGGHKWPRYTNLALNGSGKINILDQSPTMSIFLHECIEWVIHNLAFLHFFPEAHDKYAEIICLMIKSSEDGEFPDIAARMRSDPAYSRLVAHIPANRVSHYRKDVRDAIVPLVAAAYHLLTPVGALDNAKRTIDEIKARVVALKHGRAYLFAFAPGDVVQRIDSKPFEHPMLAIGLRAAFFGASGPTSIATMYAHELKSEEINESEIPVAMLAMVATVISGTLDAWSTGLYVAPKAHVDTMGGVYKGTLTFLELICTGGSDAKFHRMLANCLKAAKEHTMEATELTAQQDAEGIDFTKMAE
ncbi:hypothetical protein EUX98_g2564 [Antrodiella citrinella]|uniref:DUF6532 domain-containing protein n=1 Tax=Antrodiella citrinella TaxID=2447956 RepID=A0A4S4N008_9APHY|nr:hypothetical protein EUX98_g2564 [Antrodiella citrinella]